MAGWPSTYSYGYPTQGYQDPTAAYYAQYANYYPGYGQGGYQQSYYPQQQPVQPPQQNYNTMPTAPSQPVPELPQDTYQPPPQYEPPQSDAPAPKKRTWLGRIWSFAWRAAVVAGAFFLGQVTADGKKAQPSPTDPNVFYNTSSEFMKFAPDAGDPNKLGAASPIHLVKGEGDNVFALEIDKATGTAKLVNPDELAMTTAGGKTKTEASTALNEPANSALKAQYDKLVATFQKLA